MIDHAAMLLLLRKGNSKPNLVAAPDVGWMASSAVFLVAGWLLRFVFHFGRAVLFPSFFPIAFPCSISFSCSSFFLFFLLSASSKAEGREDFTTNN